MYDRGFDIPYRRRPIPAPPATVHYPRRATWLHKLIGRTPPCVCGAAWPCPDAGRP